MNQRDEQGSRRDVDDRLADWVDGRMSDKERERFVAELRVNAQLRQDLEQYERTVGVVRAALRAPAEPARVADRVMAAIAAGGASPATRRAGGSARARLWWSAAAAAALLATAVVIDRFGPSQPGTRDTASVDAPGRANDDGKQPEGSWADGKKSAAGSAGNAPMHADKSEIDQDGAPAAGKLRQIEEQVAVPKPEAPTRAKAANERQPGEPSPALLEEVQRELQGARAEPTPAPAAPPPAEKLAAGTPAPEAARDTASGAAIRGAQPPAGPATPGPAGPATGGPAGPTTGGRDRNLGAPLQGAGGPGSKPGSEPGSAAEGRKQGLDERAVTSGAETRDAMVAMIVVEGIAVATKPVDTKAAEAKDLEKETSKEQRGRRGAAQPSGGGGGGEAGKAKNDDAAHADDFYLGSRSTLDAAALAANIDAFLADAAAPSTAAAAIVLATERGELRLSPMVDEATKKPAPSADPTGATPADPMPAKATPADKERAEKLAAAAVVERTWLVEGANADVEVVLARLHRFAQQHKLTQRTGETTAPAPPRGDSAGAPSPQSSSSRGTFADRASGAQSTVKRVVLRFRMRPR